MNIRLPIVVAAPSFLGQAASLSATVFTPAADGLFRISFYIESSVPISSITAGAQWTDDFNSGASQPAFAFSPSLGPTGNAGQATVVNRAKAATPIAIFVTDTGGLLYDLFVTVEQL